MADYPERLPVALSDRLANASSAIYTRFGREVDVAIGGIPFRLATTTELPQSIETVAVRKDQFDVEPDPGEQSLSGYWRRSQASFHLGAGYKYESNTTDEAFAGFFDSSGVDVFTQGRITLLRKMVLNTVPSAMATVYTRRGNQHLIGADGDLYVASGGTVTSKWVSPSGNFTDFILGFSTPASTFAVTDTGRLYKTDVESPVSTAYWLLGSLSGVTLPKIMWAKYRLWVFCGANIYQPDVSVATDAGATPLVPIFTNPQINWQYTCMAEGPSAVYFGGHDGEESSIQSITLDPDGFLPTLSGATTAVVLPQGEKVVSLSVVAGQYIGIGTSEGFRVGRIESDGSITYGPLLLSRLTNDSLTTTFRGCVSQTAFGDYFIVSLRDDEIPARTYKVNTALEISPLVFPYARDIEVSGAANGTYFGSLAVGRNTSGLPNRTLAVLSNGDYYEQHYTDLVSSGWLQTSRIRFHTTEAKNYKFLNVEIEPLTGSMSFDLVLEGGSTISLGNATAQGEIYNDPFGITLDPMKYASVKITLSQTSASHDPTLLSYLLRAVPAVKPQRLITLPLLCFDKEAGRSGQRYGAEGYAADRLRALQLLEDVSATVTYQSFIEPGAPGLPVTIESARFVQTSPGDPVGREGAGGILVLQLKTMEA